MRACAARTKSGLHMATYFPIGNEMDVRDKPHQPFEFNFPKRSFGMKGAQRSFQRDGFEGGHSCTMMKGEI